MKLEIKEIIGGMLIGTYVAAMALVITGAVYAAIHFIVKFW